MPRMAISLEMIFMSANEKLRIAKLKVLNGNVNMRLFSCLLYKYDIFITDIPGPIKTAFVTFNKNKFEMYFDKEFVESHTSQELVYVIIHEQCHVLNNHLERGRNKEHKSIYNIACDHVINNRLDNDVSNGELVNIKIPKERVIINYFKDKNVTAEEIYDYLIENAKFEKTKIKFKINSDGSCSISNISSDSDEPSENENSNGSDSTNSKDSNDSSNDYNSTNNISNNELEIELTTIKITMPDGQVIEHTEDIDMNSKISQKQAIEKVKEMQGEAKAILNSDLIKDRQRGTRSSGILELIKEAVEVPLPWDELIEHAIKSTITISNDNKSWKNLNKRLQCHNILLPSFGTEERISTLVMCNDTSGSMSVNDFKKFLSIIKNSVSYFTKVIKIDHDYKITDYKEFTSDEILMSNENIYNFTGRGGTSHKEVFNKIEEMIYENDEEVSLIFFLTDFESDIEHLWKSGKYRWIREIPLKLILTSKHKVPEFIDKSPIYI